MKAIILGAGLGTRLRPITDTTPKILVPVCGVPMLDRVLVLLAHGGVTEAALNTHHLAAAVTAHVARPGAQRLRLSMFHEPQILGTGGALVNARAFWGTDPLVVWNGDVLADVDLPALAAAHANGGSLATLVTQRRPESSRLLVDGQGRLRGIDSPARGGRRMVGGPSGTGAPVQAVAFNGISLLSPALLPLIDRSGPFDLVDALLDVAAAGGAVSTFDMGSGFWGTSGDPAQLARLEKLVAEGAASAWGTASGR